MEVIKRFGDEVLARDVSASVAGADRSRAFACLAILASCARSEPLFVTSRATIRWRCGAEVVARSSTSVPDPPAVAIQ
jgi:hypothetical protein